MSLPKGFKRLSYIQSSGTQYIDTLFKPNQNTRVVFDMVATAVSGWPFGCRTSGSAAQFGVMFNSETVFRHTYGTATAMLNVTTTVRSILDQNKNALTFNGATSTITAQTFSCAYSLYLFNLNNAGSPGTGFQGKCYYCQIYDNGNLVRDFIPCQNASGAVGLWDSVNEVFYGNAGTGTFTAGPEVQTVPNAPANFRAEAVTDTLVTLAWEPMEEVLGYRLYRQGQLLADTTETFVSVTVEPFAGAVFTVTAYNENGEGAGSTLTYFSIPDNPILFLITDRTHQDVSELNPKGYYDASDLNRVGYAVEYLAGRLKSSGVTVTVSPVLTWTDVDWPTPSTMQNYLADVQTMRGALKLANTTPKAPDDLVKLTYEETNQIEMILLVLDNHIRNMLAIVDAGWASGLAYTGFYAKETY